MYNPCNVQEQQGLLINQARIALAETRHQHARTRFRLQHMYMYSLCCVPQNYAAEKLQHYWHRTCNNTP